MDAQRLKQYRALQREIKQLERQLRQIKASRSRPGRMVADTVQTSSPDWPYTEHTLRIRGWLPGGMVDKDQIKQLEDLLEDRKRRCVAELVALEGYISSITDSKTRQLLSLRYVEGLTLQEVAQEVGYDRSVVGKKIKQALK